MMDQNSHDESFAHLLNALNKTEPDAGFTQRMIRGVEARQSAALALKKTPRLLWSLSFASAIAAALIVVLSVKHQHSHPADQVVTTRSPRFQVPAQASKSSGYRATLGELRYGSTANKDGGPAASPRQRAASRFLAPQTTRVEAELDPSQARSFPAPPLPLTNQEKLLLRIAHTGDPVEFAALNAERRRRVAAQEEEAYLQIFPPPLSAEEEDNLVLKISKGDIQ